MFNHFWKIISVEIRLNNIDGTRNYVTEKINQNELNKKNKKFCTTLDYFEDFLTLSSTVTAGVYISAFAYLFGIPIGITSSALGLKTCAIAAGIKNWEMKKNREMIK